MPRDLRLAVARGRSARAGRRVLAFVAGTTLLASCTDLAPGSIEYRADPLSLADASTLQTGDLADPAWACLDDPTPVEPPPEVPSVSFVMPIVDSTTGLPPADLSVRACQLIDVSCLAPVNPTPAGVGDDGLVHLSLPFEFGGFLEITSSDTVPSLFFLYEPLRRDTVSSALPLISTGALVALATNNGVSLDSTNDGLLLIRTYDCDGQSAANVRLSTDRGGQLFTFVGGLPLVGDHPTSDDGIGGFINVPPGFARVEGRHAQTGELTGAASLVVRPEWMTYGDLHPTSVN